jgi:hypothetical protein
MIAQNSTFSADVKLQLHVGERTYEIGHLGPGFALLGEAQPISATQAELETIIDGQSTRWPIRITSPTTADSKRFAFEAI